MKPLYVPPKVLKKREVKNGFSLEGRKKNAALFVVKDTFLLLKSLTTGEEERKGRRERQGREKEDNKEKRSKQVR